MRLLAEIHHEFDRPLHVAFLHIKAPFDSVDRQALWKALRSRGIPNILLDLIVALHEHTGYSVRHGGKLSTRFPTIVRGQTRLCAGSGPILRRD